MPVTVASVNLSSGGIPKSPVSLATITFAGIEGDAHDHEKHNRPTQAICLFDLGGLDELRREGYDLVPGSLGENVTLDGVDADALDIGDRLRFSGGVEIEITRRRTPCYVLDAIDESLKTTLVNRAGVYAKVLVPGTLRADESVEIVRSAEVVA